MESLFASACVEIYAYITTELEPQNRGKITIDGCYMYGRDNALSLTEVKEGAFEKGFDVEIKNGTLKTGYVDGLTRWSGDGAILGCFNIGSTSGIKKIISNYDREVFEDTETDTAGNVKYECESTYNNLVFKDGKLISATQDPSGEGKKPGDDPGDDPGDGGVWPTVMYDSEKIKIGTDLSFMISSNRPPKCEVNKIESSNSNYQRLINEINGIVNNKYKITILGAFEAKTTENANDRIDILVFDVGTKYNGSNVIIGYLNKNSEYKYYEATVENGQVEVSIKDGVTVGMIALKGTTLPKTGEETNKFENYLGTVVVLSAVWLGTMLLIDREKKKMTKR